MPQGRFNMLKFVHRFKWPDRKKHKHTDGSYHRVAEPYHEFAGWVFDATGGGIAGSFVNAALADKPMPGTQAPPNSPARPPAKPAGAKAVTEPAKPAPPAAQPTPQTVKPASDHPAPKRRSSLSDDESLGNSSDEHRGSHDKGGEAASRRGLHDQRKAVDDGESFT